MISPHGKTAPEGFRQYQTNNMETVDTPEQENPAIAQTKQLRKELDEVLQNLRRDSDREFTGIRSPLHPVRSSAERTIAMRKIQEAIMWLGMDLKALGTPSPYPDSYNPESPVIEPTADGLKL